MDQAHSAFPASTGAAIAVLPPDTGFFRAVGFDIHRRRGALAALATIVRVCGTIGRFVMVGHRGYLYVYARMLRQAVCILNNVVMVRLEYQTVGRR